MKKFLIACCFVPSAFIFASFNTVEQVKKSASYPIFCDRQKLVERLLRQAEEINNNYIQNKNIKFPCDLTYPQFSENDQGAVEVNGQGKGSVHTSIQVKEQKVNNSAMPLSTLPHLSLEHKAGQTLSSGERKQKKAHISKETVIYVYDASGKQIARKDAPELSSLFDELNVAVADDHKLKKQTKN